MKFSYTQSSVKSISVFLSGFKKLFLAKAVKVNIIKRVSKHSREMSIELSFFIKSFYECTENSRNFQGTFLYVKNSDLGTCLV